MTLDELKEVVDKNTTCFDHFANIIDAAEAYAKSQNSGKPIVSGSLPTYEEFKLEYERREACDLPKGYSKKDYLAGFHQCYKWIRRQMLVGNGR